MNLIREVKERADIVKVAQLYGIQLNRAYKCICPFHKEKTASLSISPQKQIWKCFGCGKGGDVISLVSKLLNVNAFEAAKSINYTLGLGLDPNQKTSRFEINKYKMKQGADSRLKKWRLETFILLTNYLHLLWKWEEIADFKNDLFIEALREKEKVQYFIDILIDGVEQDWIWLKNTEIKYIEKIRKGGSDFCGRKY